MTTVPALLTAMATVARAGISTTALPVVAYPPVASITRSPTLVFMWGKGLEENAITHKGPEVQEWVGQITGRVLVTHQDNSPAEMARIDALVTELVDVFGIDADGRSVVEREAATFGSRVYELLPVQTRNSLTVEYAGAPCYASDVIFAYRLDRQRSA